MQQLDGDENITIEIIEDLGPNSLQEALQLCQAKGYLMTGLVSRFLSGVAVSAMLNPKQSV